ncbi:MAG: RHS repeat-associated core domain-containing protein, partial [Terracidiphilus sp.]
RNRCNLRNALGLREAELRNRVRSRCSGEQYDSDLGLYYLRARYYNPLTGRFMSRDPWSGNQFDPRTLHRYLYVGSNPVNDIDPRGRDLFEYAIEQSASIPEAKLIDIYGCVADASLAAVDLIINPQISLSTELGGGAAVIGCVLLTPGLDELAVTGSKLTKRAIGAVKFIGKSADWGSCALDIGEFVNELNAELSGTANGVQITDSLTELAGCVGNALGHMLAAKAP